MYKAKPQRLSVKTQKKLKIMARKLEDEDVKYFDRTNIHLIEVAVDRMELFDEAIISLEKVTTYLENAYKGKGDDLYPYEAIVPARVVLSEVKAIK